MVEQICEKIQPQISGFSYYWATSLRRRTFGNAPPGQRHVREERVQWRRLLPSVLLPEVEGLREAATGPQRIVGAVVQFCELNNKT